MSRFNDKLLAWATAVGALGTMLLCLPMCYYGVAAWVQARDTIAASKSLGEDHETRLRSLEKDLGAIRVEREVDPRLDRGQEAGIRQLTGGYFRRNTCRPPSTNQRPPWNP